MLFTFPSRNYSTIGRKRYLALPSGLGRFPQNYTCSVVLKKSERRLNFFVYETITLYGIPFQVFSTKVKLCNFSISLSSNQLTLTTLILHERQPTSSLLLLSQRDSRFRFLLHNMSLSYFLFARHYSGNHLLVSFLAGTERFHFPTFPPIQLWIHCMATRFKPSRVTPFGNLWINACLAATQSLSQPTTSFIGLLRQGIHRTPLICFIEIAILFSFKCATPSTVEIVIKNNWTYPNNYLRTILCLFRKSKHYLLFPISIWTWGESNSWPPHCKWGVLAIWTTGPNSDWWACQDSNLGPQSYQDCALASWAIRPSLIQKDF